MDADSLLDPRTPPLVIDPTTLKCETLSNLAKEFVLREQANDDGSNLDLESSIKRAKQLIDKGELLITFDPSTESVGILHRLDPALNSLKSPEI